MSENYFSRKLPTQLSKNAKFSNDFFSFCKLGQFVAKIYLMFSFREICFVEKSEKISFKRKKKLFQK